MTWPIETVTGTVIVNVIYEEVCWCHDLIDNASMKKVASSEGAYPWMQDKTDKNYNLFMTKMAKIITKTVEKLYPLRLYKPI